MCMDTFLVGFLSAVVIMFLVIVVAGIVGVVKLFKRTTSFVNDVVDIHNRIDRETERLDRRIDENAMAIESKVDSQINKLENRLRKL